MRANPSGFRITQKEVPTIIAMRKRGDRDHDIAAWFGVNQGRIKSAKDGMYGGLTDPTPKKLPPKGPPGIKGRRLREEVGDTLKLLSEGDVAKATMILKKAAQAYDADEQ